MIKTSILLFTLTVSAFAYEKTTLTVMSYNVENLFNTRHDSTNNDWTFLPKRKKDKSEEHTKACEKVEVKHWQDECFNLDWNQKILRKKMWQLAETIKQVKNGQGPDILILQEVEMPESVLYKGVKQQTLIEVFTKKYLDFASYLPAHYLRGPDKRGIGVVILSRLPLAKNLKPQMHVTAAFKSALQKHRDDTRGILEVPLQLPGGATLYTYGLHLPAQHVPGPGDSSMRIAQFNHLKDLVLQRKSEAKNQVYFLAAGDCNVNAAEEKPLYDLMADVSWISHRVGLKKNVGEGTYVFRKKWSFLDAIFVDKDVTKLKSKRLPAKPEMQPYLDLSSIRVMADFAEQTYADTGFPKRFNKNTGEGVSDHLPLVLDLIVPSEPKSSKSLKRRKLKGYRYKAESGPIKVAFFDADSTLRVAPSGSFSANSSSDVYMLPFVAEKIKSLVKQGYLIAVVSNQGGVASGKVSYDVADGGLQTIAHKITAAGGKVHYTDFASTYDWNRKGNIGMGVRLDHLLRVKYGVGIDKFNSFMVGDAEYKEINFSPSDRLFAENFGIRFQGADKFFGWDAYKVNALTKYSEALDLEKQIDSL